MNIRSLVGLAIAWGLLTTSIAFAKENAQSAVVGDWHGSSICLVRRSACHDEEALYHVKAGEKAGTFLMQADKVVNGKPQVMGPPAECSNKEKDVLHCEFGRGFLDLTLQGDHLDGAMFLTDKTRWRDIKLTRVKQQPTP